jgi:CxxC-x17-CxxC domain-containing protein
MGFNNFRGPRNFGPREMHKATCSKCKKECEVPFKPTEGKPVYCKECYATMPKPERRF